MATGLLIGEFVPIIPRILSKFEIAGISIPIAVLIWAMIYPMMLKVDFESVKRIGRNPRGLMLTWIVNIPAALATTVGVLTEVPIMLMLVRFANNRRHFFN